MAAAAYGSPVVCRSLSALGLIDDVMRNALDVVAAAPDTPPAVTLADLPDGLIAKLATIDPLWRSAVVLRLGGWVEVSDRHINLLKLVCSD